MKHIPFLLCLCLIGCEKPSNTVVGEAGESKGGIGLTGWYYKNHPDGTRTYHKNDDPGEIQWDAGMLSTSTDDVRFKRADFDLLADTTEIWIDYRSGWEVVSSNAILKSKFIPSVTESNGTYWIRFKSKTSMEEVK